MYSLTWFIAAVPISLPSWWEVSLNEAQRHVRHWKDSRLDRQGDKPEILSSEAAGFFFFFLPCNWMWGGGTKKNIWVLCLFFLSEEEPLNWWGHFLTKLCIWHQTLTRYVNNLILIVQASWHALFIVSDPCDTCMHAFLLTLSWTLTSTRTLYV